MFFSFMNGVELRGQLQKSPAATRIRPPVVSFLPGVWFQINPILGRIEKSETELTASVLKENQNTKVKKNVF